MIELVLIALLQAATPAEPAPAPAPEAAAAAPEVEPTTGDVRLVVPPPPDEDPNARVCETRATPGTRMRTRVCGSRADQQRVRRLARETVDHIHALPRPIRGGD